MLHLGGGVTIHNVRRGLRGGLRAWHRDAGVGRAVAVGGGEMSKGDVSRFPEDRGGATVLPVRFTLRDRPLEEEERVILQAGDLAREDREEDVERDGGVPEACVKARARMSFLCRERRETHSSHRRLYRLIGTKGRPQKSRAHVLCCSLTRTTKSDLAFFSSSMESWRSPSTPREGWGLEPRLRGVVAGPPEVEDSGALSPVMESLDPRWSRRRRVMGLRQGRERVAVGSKTGFNSVYITATTCTLRFSVLRAKIRKNAPIFT